MEYIRPSPSFIQKVRIFFLDLLFILICVRRFIEDHSLSPFAPQPQPLDKNERPSYLHVKNSDVTKQETRETRKKKSATYPREDARSYVADVTSASAPAAENVTNTTSTSSTSNPSSSSASSSSSSSSSSSTTGSSPPRLRVLSHNIWGLPISPRTDVRNLALCHSFHLFDLICLQECSHEREIQMLRERAMQAGFKYQSQFTMGVGFPIWHGVTGPGLVVLSRYPILDIQFKRYSINGKMYQFAHADYMSAKGVGLVRIDVSEMVYPAAAEGKRDECRPVVGVDVFLTHMHANYTNFEYDWRKWLPTLNELQRRLHAGESTASLAASMPIPLSEHVEDEYLAHRILQAYECARFIGAMRRRDFLVLLCGDLNCTPTDLCTQLIQSVAFGQFPDNQPRFIDSFHAVHPHSRGLTCGAKDNTFTFSTEPIKMERISMQSVATNDAKLASEASDLTKFNLQAAMEAQTSASSSSTLTADELNLPYHRDLYNCSPGDSTLIPSSVENYVSRTKYGEHVTLLSSSQLPLASSAHPSTSPLSSNFSTASLSSIERAPSKPLGITTLNPLSWIDVHDDTAKRIDYIFYSNPSSSLRCKCETKKTQLPFHSVTQEEEMELKQSCTCKSESLPPSSHLWSVESASVFKQYMLEEETGALMSLSDHHGVSATYVFHSTQKEYDDFHEKQKNLKQSSSTIIISRMHEDTMKSCQWMIKKSKKQLLSSSFATSSSTPFAIPSFVTDVLPLKPLPLSSVDPDLFHQLYTLDDEVVDAKSPHSSAQQSRMQSRRTSSAFITSSSSPPIHPTPVLPSSSILLLSEGLLWYGLRDASDRRVSHLQRMFHAFLIFIIGSKTMWMYILNSYFETLMMDVLPNCVLEFPLPTTFVTFMRVLLFVIDWCHTILPIYIVIEWLLTTFPAKEEQMAIRQCLQEIQQLREYQSRKGN